MKQLSESSVSFIEENTILPEDGKNLRRKIDSICRTIENLSAKKLNLEVEIKVQKRVLKKKREELKKRSKSNSTRLKAALESVPIEEKAQASELQKIVQIDQTLLRVSNFILENE